MERGGNVVVIAALSVIHRERFGDSDSLFGPPYWHVCEYFVFVPDPLLKGQVWIVYKSTFSPLSKP